MCTPQTLERSYLLRLNGQVVERPQHMLMRVSLGIHKTDLASAIATYHLLSERWWVCCCGYPANLQTPGQTRGSAANLAPVRTTWFSIPKPCNSSKAAAREDG